VSTSVSTPY